LPSANLKASGSRVDLVRLLGLIDKAMGICDRDPMAQRREQSADAARAHMRLGRCMARSDWNAGRIQPVDATH